MTTQIRMSKQLAREGAAAGDVATWDGSKWVPQAPSTVTTSAFHGVKVYRSTNQSIPASAWTAASWDAEVWDTDALHDPATNPTRLTVPPALGSGHVHFEAQILFSTVGSAVGVDVGLRVWKNGTTEICRFEQPTPNPATINNTLQTHGIDAATTGDFYELQAWHANSGAINLAGGAAFSWMSATWLG